MGLKSKFFVLFPLMWTVVAGHATFGQVTTASLSGVVRDASGAVLPGVTVTIKNTGTGFSRTVITDEEGRYRAPQLSLGDYEVQGELPGFKTVVRSGIKLTVGREAVVDLVLEIGEISQRVTVTGEAPLVQTTSTDIGGLVDDKKIRDLPLNGRDFTQLVMLQPGVVQQRFVLQSPNAGQGLRLSVGGARMDYNNFIIDGTRKNEFGGTTTGSVAGVQLGVDALKEFKVVTHNYSAEFGQNAGAIVTAVTKSGTNEFHGSVFEFHRNDNLDARNFFDRDPSHPTVRSNPPEFKRNQFGFAGGGPIVKDKTFFFGSFESFRERRATTNTAFVPTVAARQGLLTDPRTGAPVTVDPRVKPFLDLFPLPNGRDLGGGAGVFTFAFTQPANDDFFTLRVDHRFSEKDSIFVRYQFSDADRAEPRGPGVFQDVITSRQQQVSIEETRIFSPNFLNTFHFGYNRATPALDSVPTISIDPSLAAAPGRKVPRLVFSGAVTAAAGAAGGAITELGPTNVDGGRWTTNSFQYKDDVVYTRGKHSVKSGFYAERLQFNIFQGDVNGQMNFTSLADFLQARPTILRIETTEGARAWRQTILGVYVQDDLNVRPHLTVNLGLRWEIATAHKDKFGRNPVFHDQLAPAVTIADRLFDTPLKNFEPRLGFAWDPLGTGRTSLRGGFGVFHNQIVGRADLIGLTRNPPFGGMLEARNPSFPPSLAFQQLQAQRLFSLNGWPEDLDTPTLYHYNLNLEREIIPNTVLRVGYVGSQGRHLVTERQGNAAIPELRPDGKKFFPAGSRPRNPNFSNVSWFNTDANSFYNALELSLNRRFSQGVQFQVSYTLSKAVDDQSSLVGADNRQDVGFLLDPDDRKSDRGPSINDVRQNLVLNYTVDLPVGPGRFLDVGGAAGKILGGWQLNGIVTASSGVPFTPRIGFNRSRNADSRVPDRPDLLPGRSNNPRIGDPNRWFDPTAFALPEAGTFGNLGRSTVRAPGVAVFDFALVKNVPLPSISEEFNIQFRAEFFNLFNRANFGLPRLTVFDGTGSILGNVGVITDTVTTSREVQFGLKVMF